MSFEELKAVVAAADAALVMARALVEAPAKTDSPYSLQRKSTYVFRRDGAGHQHQCGHCFPPVLCWYHDRMTAVPHRDLGLTSPDC